MKRKLATLFAALSLLAGLAFPAGAWEMWAYPPRKYRTFQEYLDFYRSQEDEGTKELVEYIDQRLAEGWAESFDADTYFRENLEDGRSVTKGNWIGWNGDFHDARGVYDEEWFRSEMMDDALTQSYRAYRDAQEAREKEARFQALTQKYPEVYAAFDPYAWFNGYYGAYGAVLETYMYNWGLDEAGFKRTMFMEWADKDPNSFFNGYCVTVDGTPIPFQFQSYRDLDGEVTGPRVENERILIPLRAAAEALGLTVEWKPETNQVVCANEKTTVTFTLDSLEYSGGRLDAAPFAEKGITYLPLRALGETLGCGVEWKQEFATAALTTR